MYLLKSASASILAALLILPFGAKADENTDKVVAKMAEGDVSAICQGGRETIAASSAAATRALAQAGQINGDYAAIGAAAGKQFYSEKCK